MTALEKSSRAIKRKIHRAKLNGIELSISDCIPRQKPPSQIDRTFKLLNDYFEVIRITNMIEGANSNYIPSELEKSVIQFCREQLQFIDVNIRFKQRLAAKFRLNKIVEKLNENGMINKKLLSQLRSIKNEEI